VRKEKETVLKEKARGHLEKKQWERKGGELRDSKKVLSKTTPLYETMDGGVLQ